MEEAIKNYKKAGEVLDTVLSKARRIIKEGTDLLSIAEELEKDIFQMGASPAFPCNLSVDRQAAHYTPGPEGGVEAAGVLKVDCGVHVDGHIADAAITLDLTGEWGKLVESAEEALREALAVIKDGVEVKEVGRAVKEVADKYGFRPVENLGGHSIERYALHAGLFIPNVPRGSGVLKEGMVVAVEPFITTGVGRVVDSSPIEIFSLSGRRSRSPRAEKARQAIEKEYGTLPFARRWIVKKFGEAGYRWLKFLVLDGSVSTYPVLVDPKGIVAQAEATVLVEKDGVTILAGGKPVRDI